MNNRGLIVKAYKSLKKRNYVNITKLFCLDCVDHSLKWLNKKCSMNKKMEMSVVVYEYYLETEIQISKISDIICEHWDEYLNDDDFDIHDYTEVF